MSKIILDNRIMPAIINAGIIDNIVSNPEPVTIPHYIMYVVTSGQAAITIHNTDLVLNEGSIYFITSKTKHTIKGLTNYNDINIIYFHFDMNVNTEHSTNQFEIPIHIKDINGSILYEKISSYFEFYNSQTRYPDTDINSRFYDILAECVKFTSDYHQGHPNLSDSIITFLTEHATVPLNTKDMEKRFFLTYKYMGTVFKKKTGYTILGYHTKLRMESAARMLENTFYSIDEISGQLGYSDPLYFSRVFKKHHGISPQAYRKSIITSRST